MTADSQPSDYLLLFRNALWDRDLTPEDIAAIMERMAVWFDALDARGVVEAGVRLTAEGRLLTQRPGQFLVDGPFVESKEAVAGYLHVRVATMEEAIAIARSWPGLDHDLSVEVRPIISPRSENANV